MSDAALNIKRFERQVMWRKRLLSLQDRVALMVLISCAVAAGLVLLARLKEGGRFHWPILLAIIAVEAAAFSLSWMKARADERQAAFAIDDALGLEDRIVTAHEIIEQRRPKRDVEAALVEDAASRVVNQRASAVAPYRLKRWHALSLAGIIALVAALSVPERALPGGEAIAEARADIQAAGEQLEQAATEAEQIAPAESETANLAREQAELGRSFRRADETRAEALKKLSSLEGRIRERHDTLAETRADEIVNIAEKRMRAALSTKPKQRAQAAVNENDETREQALESSDTEAKADAKAAKPAVAGERKAQSATPSGKSERAGVSANKTDASNSNQSDLSIAQRPNRGTGQQQANTNSVADKSGLAANTKPDSRDQAGQQAAQNRLQEPVSSPNAQPQTDNKNQAGVKKERDQSSSEADAAGDQKEPGKDEQKPEGSLAVPKALGGLVADQAAKALPQMSQELLNKAAQLRAGQLSPEEIKRLAQAAQFLAQDLKQIAQSKEFQQALEQMARQISPEQIEQVARQLMNQEQLKRELEASARLMMQNQQAKEIVAGIKQSVEDLAKQFRGREGNEQRGRSRGAGDAAQDGKGGAGNNSRLQLGRPDSQKLKGQGKESNASGNLQRGTGGEYLYLRSQAGTGAARAPYSSAYPQYRREAERSVERSQVPPHMRSMVRSYFDAINPDASKKP